MGGTSFQPVKSDVNKIGRDLKAHRHRLGAQGHVRYPVLSQDIEHFFVNPRRVPEFNRMTNSTVEPSQEAGQALEIFFERARQLPQDRTPMFS